METNKQPAGRAHRAPVRAAAPALKLATFTIRREGQVEWRVTGDTHCGPKAEVRDGIMPVRYVAAVTCAPSLDERGFLFDQAAVDMWMRRIAARETALSCEALVRSVAEQLLAKIARDVPTCRVVGLTLSLSPSPYQASITVTYG
jgi:hypothetical protein